MYRMYFVAFDKGPTHTASSAPDSRPNSTVGSGAGALHILYGKKEVSRYCTIHILY